ncbi:MAG: hypothetical protein KDK70_38545, partial [Myxococcales bacterium]|nr:hypothetical protein [Myxococcales bacterium]
YRLRLQCEQVGAVTELRARVWPAGDPEPAAWDVVHADDTITLQDTPGGFAIDMFNYYAPLDLFVDDVVVAALP